jgi:hypothetical protein
VLVDDLLTYQSCIDLIPVLRNNFKIGSCDEYGPVKISGSGPVGIRFENLFALKSNNV